MHGLFPKLRIFGEGHLRPQLEATILALGLTDQVSLEGFAPSLDLAFASSLFNVLASETEGFPNVVVEAAAANTASLVTDVDGSRDTVPPEISLPNKVPVRDIEALVTHLAAWFKRPQEVLADGCAFREFLSARCATDVVRANYLGIYRSLLAKRESALGLNNFVPSSLMVADPDVEHSRRDTL
jgi:glycosyltransferase involved in cell wall biosynthesis